LWKLAGLIRCAAERFAAQQESRHGRTKPKQSPLDAERVRLQEAGYTDYEISQILIARASAPSQGMGTGIGAGQGVLSGGLNNLGAVFSTARNAVPDAMREAQTALTGGTTLSERMKAIGSLVLKAAILAMLGYGAARMESAHHQPNGNRRAQRRPCKSPSVQGRSAPHRTLTMTADARAPEGRKGAARTDRNNRRNTRAGRISDVPPLSARCLQ
jgi:hypothetical protein